MRLPRKWLLAMAVMTALPQAGFAQQAPSQVTSESAVSAARDNKAVAQDIARGMKSAGLTGRQIQIEVKDGVAVIRGLIGDAAQKQTVTELAMQVAGVSRVDNLMQPMTAEKAAPAIQTAAFEQPSATQQPIRQVSGETPAALPQTAAAAKPVQATQPAGRTSLAIAQDVKKNLLSVVPNRYDIEIRVKNGECLLQGAVKHPAEAAQAQYVAGEVDGVNKVINLLTVDGRPAAPMIAEAEARYAAAQQQQRVQQTAGQYGPQGRGPQGHPQMSPQQMQMAQMQMGGPVQGMPGPAGQIQPVGHAHNPGVYNRPALPEYAWPAYAAHDNYAAVTYPGQYDASAFPYIGPFYPYPQVPLGWRKAQLEWDDGYWNLDFDSRTDKWFWFLNPKNWD